MKKEYFEKHHIKSDLRFQATAAETSDVTNQMSQALYQNNKWSRKIDGAEYAQNKQSCRNLVDPMKPQKYDPKMTNAASALIRSRIQSVSTMIANTDNDQSGQMLNESNSKGYKIRNASTLVRSGQAQIANKQRNFGRRNMSIQQIKTDHVMETLMAHDMNRESNFEQRLDNNHPKESTKAFHKRNRSLQPNAAEIGQMVINENDNEKRPFVKQNSNESQLLIRWEDTCTSPGKVTEQASSNMTEPDISHKIQFDEDQKEKIYLAVKNKFNPPKENKGLPELKLYETDETTYIPRKGEIWEPVRNQRHYRNYQETTSLRQKLGITPADYEVNQKIIAEIRSQFTKDNQGNQTTSLQPDSVPGKRKPELLKVNRFIQADEALKSLVNPPVLDDKSKNTIYQFQMYPKYFQKHGLRHSEISAIPNSVTRAYASSQGFILPPLGGRPFNTMSMLSDINKKLWTNIRKMEKPPISWEECNNRGMSIVQKIKDRELFLTLIMKGTTGDLKEPDLEDLKEVIHERGFEYISKKIKDYTEWYIGREMTEHEFKQQIQLVEIFSKQAEVAELEKIEKLKESFKYGTHTPMNIMDKINQGQLLLNSFPSLQQQPKLLPGQSTSTNQERFSVIRQQSLFNVLEHFYDKFQRVVIADQEKTNNIAKKLKEKVIETQEFKRVTMADPIKKELHKPDAKYIQECSNDASLALPILNKIRGKTLCLQQYTLSQPQCDALAKACELFDDKQINRVFFENCGIKDSEMAAMLRGLDKLQDFKSIIYKQNEFDLLSLEALQPLLLKRLPLHLEELRIVDCRIKESVCRSLVETLIEKSQLAILTLSKANLSEMTLSLITKYVTINKNLQQLDLSFSRVSPEAWATFFQNIKKNQTLTHLSLASNQILCMEWEPEVDPNVAEEKTKSAVEVEIEDPENEEPDQPKETPYVYEPPHKPLQQILNEYEERKGDDFKLKQKRVHENQSNQAKDYQQKRKEMLNEAIHNLCFFLKRNRKLKHVNLSNCDLSTNQIRTIVSCLRRVQAMQAIHLSYNPGWNHPSLKEEMIDRVHCKEAEEYVQLCPPSKKLGSKTLQGKAFSEAQVLATYNIAKRVVQNPVHTHGVSGTFIFQRQLGNRGIMRAKGQWNLLTEEKQECWVCGTHCITVFLWHESLRSKEEKGIKEYYQKQLADQKSDKQVTISGEFTNWKPKRMYNLTDLLQKQVVSKMLASRFKSKLTNSRVGVDSALSNYMNDEDDSDDDDFNKPIPDFQGATWRPYLMKQLNGYRNPTIVNGVELLTNQNTLESPLYVYFDFVKPGKQVYCINNPKKGSVDGDGLYVDHALVKHRSEPIPHYRKTKTRMVVRQFSYETSVFANFVHDNAKMIKDCFENDKSFYKVRRLRYKDDELEELEYYMRKNYNLFMDAYRFLMHQGGEVMTIMDIKFKSWCEALGIVQPRNDDGYHGNKNVLEEQLEYELKHRNAQISHQDIDICWTSVNSANLDIKQELGVENPTNQLVRYEFTEILVRISENLYRKATNPRHKLETLTLSLQKFMDEILVPFMDETVIQEWGSKQWRYRELYNLEINDLIVANKDNINSLIAHYALMPIQGLTFPVKNRFSYLHAMQLNEDAQFGLSNETVRMVFGLSKQTVVNDNDLDGQRKLQLMTAVEFYEYIGRLASVKFLGTELEELPLVEKMGYIMDDMFAVIGVERVEPNIEVEEISDSDSDY